MDWKRHEIFLLFSVGKGLRTVKPFIFVELFMLLFGPSVRFTFGLFLPWNAFDIVRLFYVHRNSIENSVNDVAFTQQQHFNRSMRMSELDVVWLHDRPRQLKHSYLLLFTLNGFYVSIRTDNEYKTRLLTSLCCYARLLLMLSIARTNQRDVCADSFSHSNNIFPFLFHSIFM